MNKEHGSPEHSPIKVPHKDFDQSLVSPVKNVSRK